MKSTKKNRTFERKSYDKKIKNSFSQKENLNKVKIKK